MAESPTSYLVDTSEKGHVLYVDQLNHDDPDVTYVEGSGVSNEPLGWEQLSVKNESQHSTHEDAHQFELLTLDKIEELLAGEGPIDSELMKSAIEVIDFKGFENFFADVDQETEDRTRRVAYVLQERFKDVNPADVEEIANLLIERGGKSLVRHYVYDEDTGYERLAWSPEAVANALINHDLYETLVLGYMDFPHIDRSRLFEKALENGNHFALLFNITAFGGVSEENKKKLVNQLWENSGEYYLAEYLDAFPFIDPTDFAVECMESNSSGALTQPGFDFTRVDLTVVRPLLEKANAYAVIYEHHGSFPDIPLDHIVDKMIENFDGYTLVADLGKRPGLDPVSLYEKLVSARMPYIILNNIDKFPEADIEHLITMEIETGHDPAWSILGVLDSNPHLDRREIIGRIVQSGKVYGLFDEDKKKNVSGLEDEELLSLFLVHNQHAALIRVRDMLAGINDDVLIGEVSKLFVGELSVSESDFTTLNDFVVENIPEADQPVALKLTNRCMKVSGASVTGYNILYNLNEGRPVGPEMRSIGITEAGNKGIDQFRKICREMSDSMLDVSLDSHALERVISSDLYLGIMQKMYRVDRSEFARTSLDSLREKMQYFLDAEQEGRIAQLDPAYKRKIDFVMTISSDKERTDITEDVRERYGVLHSDIRAALRALQTKRPFTGLLQDMGNQIKNEIHSIQEGIDTTHSEELLDRAALYKRQDLERRQQALSGLLESVSKGRFVGKDFVLRSPADMSAVFSELEQFDSLHASMRQIVFAWAIRKNPQTLEQLSQLNLDPSINDIASLRGFVEQIVNNETFGNYFGDKKVAKRFSGLTSVRALDDALVRHQREGKPVGQQTLEIIPTREFSMELSGHVGDACWADKYDSMAEKFPQMAAVLFKRGEKGSASERLVGSAMLIETTDDRGEGVLLLRGINPIENYINTIKVEDFFRAASTYVREVAAAKGMRPAIVIDDHVGGSGTNRPVLHEYITRLKDGMEPILVDSGSSFFNGYTVTNNSFAL